MLPLKEDSWYALHVVTLVLYLLQLYTVECQNLMLAAVLQYCMQSCKRPSGPALPLACILYGVHPHAVITDAI